jgi:hypothetical protein
MHGTFSGPTKNSANKRLFRGKMARLDLRRTPLPPSMGCLCESFSFVLHRYIADNLRNTIRQSAIYTTPAHFSVFLKSIYPCHVHYHFGRQKLDMFGSLYIRGQSPCHPIPLSDPCFSLFSKVRTQFLQRPQIFNMIS